MSYKKLEIWQMARELSIDIHRMTLQLPAFELYEEGRQIRKSSKSVRSNIVEGYGRRRYKQDYITSAASQPLARLTARLPNRLRIRSMAARSRSSFCS